MIGGEEDRAWRRLHGWVNDLWQLEDTIQEIRDLRWDRDRLAAAIFVHILEDRRLSRTAFHYGSSPSRWHPRRHDWQLWVALKDYTPAYLTQVLSRTGRAPFYLTQGRNGT